MPLYNRQAGYEPVTCKHRQGILLVNVLKLVQMQRTVGTVIKADEEEDAVGVASVLSTARHGSLEAMKQVHTFLLDHCPKGQLRDQLFQVSCEPPAQS